MTKASRPEASDACLMAQTLVARRNGVSFATVDTLATAVLGSVVFPPAAPFVIAGAVALGAFEWIGSRLERGDESMPDEWFPLVLATATSDGRFLVGRFLATKGRVTLSDAVTFIAVERAAEPRTGIDAPARDLEAPNARAALLEHYETNRTAFDRAARLVSDSLLSAGGMGIGMLGSTLSAARRKWRLGV